MNSYRTSHESKKTGICQKTEGLLLVENMHLPLAVSWPCRWYSSARRLVLHSSLLNVLRRQKVCSTLFNAAVSVPVNHGIHFVFRKRPISNLQNMHVPCSFLGGDTVLINVLVFNFSCCLALQIMRTFKH